MCERGDGACNPMIENQFPGTYVSDLQFSQVFLWGETGKLEESGMGRMPILSLQEALGKPLPPASRTLIWRTRRTFLTISFPLLLLGPWRDITRIFTMRTLGFPGATPWNSVGYLRLPLPGAGFSSQASLPVSANRPWLWLSAFTSLSRFQSDILPWNLSSLKEQGKPLIFQVVYLLLVLRIGVMTTEIFACQNQDQKSSKFMYVHFPSQNSSEL